MSKREIFAGSIVVTLLMSLLLWEGRREPPRDICVAIMQTAIEIQYQRDKHEPTRQLNSLAAEAVEAGIRDMLLLKGIERVHVIEGSDVRSVASDDPQQVCTATGADEVIESKVIVTRGGFGVHLTRHDRQGVVWASSFQSTNHRDIALTAGDRVREAYGARRIDHLGNGITQLDFYEYTEQLARLRSPQSDWLPAAIQDLEALRRRSPGLVGAAALEVKIASYLYRKTNEERYLQHCRRALTALQGAADRCQVLQAEINMAIETNQLDRAERSLLTLAELAPAHPYLQYYEARIARDRGDGQRAIGLLRAAVEESTTLNSLRLLADTEKQFGRIADAKEHLHQASRLAPDNISIKKQLGDVALVTCDLDIAVQLLSEACFEHPQPHWVLQLGTAFLLSGDPDRALKVYGSIEHPERPLMQTSIGDAHLALGDADQARQHYQQALAAIPQQPRPRDLALRGYLEAQLGNTEQAIQDVEEAYRLAPEAQMVAYWAAAVYSAAGNPDAAQTLAARTQQLGLGPCWFMPPWFKP